MNQNPSQQPPKIQFPCEDYMVKVVRDADEKAHRFVLEVMRRHAPELDEGRITLRDSSTGKFTSMTFYILATGEEQLRALFEELKKHPSVHMVL
ncbi:YbeD family protein [Microbulbifer sp. 2304DJ12-6]|uniref:HP0495 family protein n=1 Tax=Microbulbifer sp. 2304DJ12-6 TaxID=3233340 RepID=UPI0039AFC7E9